MHSLNKKKFIAAITVSLLLAVILLALSYTTGKQEFFLELNTDLGIFADNFFTVYTYAGDGLMWIPVLLVTIFILKRKDCIPLLVSAFILSTLFIQGIKNFVLPAEPRPIKAILETSLIHTVQGVEVHTIGSFPSGHTATAFSIYLLFCLLINKRWWLIAGFIYAGMVGYSRIYLAQHFPTDIAGGIITAVISVWLSLKIQEYWWRKKRVKTFQ